MKVLFLLLLVTACSATLNAQKKALILTSDQTIELQDGITSLRRDIISIGVHKAPTIESFIKNDVVGITKLIGDTVYGVSIFYSLLGKDTINAEVIAVKHLPDEIPSFSGDKIVHLWGRTQKTISYYGKKRWPEDLPSADIVSDLKAIIQKLRE